MNSIVDKPLANLIYSVKVIRMFLMATKTDRNSETVY